VNLCYVGIPEHHFSVSYCCRLDKRAVNYVLVIHETLSKQYMNTENKICRWNITSNTLDAIFHILLNTMRMHHTV
jgi:hypothetical protein